MPHALLDVFFTIMWLFLWNLWVFLVARIVFDTFFASRDIAGWGKAGLKSRGAITESEFQQRKARVLT